MIMSFLINHKTDDGNGLMELMKMGPVCVQYSTYQNFYESSQWGTYLKFNVNQFNGERLFSKLFELCDIQNYLVEILFYSLLKCHYCHFCCEECSEVLGIHQDATADKDLFVSVKQKNTYLLKVRKPQCNSVDNGMRNTSSHCHIHVNTKCQRWTVYPSSYQKFIFS